MLAQTKQSKQTNTKIQHAVTLYKYYFQIQITKESRDVIKPQTVDFPSLVLI